MRMVGLVASYMCNRSLLMHADARLSLISRRRAFACRTLDVTCLLTKLTL